MNFDLTHVDGRNETRIARRNDDPSRSERYVVAIYRPIKNGRGFPTAGARAWARDRFFDCPTLAIRFAENAR